MQRFPKVQAIASHRNQQEEKDAVSFCYPKECIFHRGQRENNTQNHVFSLKMPSGKRIFAKFCKISCRDLREKRAPRENHEKSTFLLRDPQQKLRHHSLPLSKKFNAEKCAYSRYRRRRYRRERALQSLTALRVQIPQVSFSSIGLECGHGERPQASAAAI